MVALGLSWLCSSLRRGLYPLRSGGTCVAGGLIGPLDSPGGPRLDEPLRTCNMSLEPFFLPLTPTPTAILPSYRLCLLQQSAHHPDMECTRENAAELSTRTWLWVVSIGTSDL